MSTPGGSPSEVIRRAAKLMRERAEAADPGPWRCMGGTWSEEVIPAVLSGDGDPADPGTWLMATGRWGGRREANAEHAASWHPLVALAVAEWLEETAKRADEETSWDWPECGHEAGCDCDLAHGWACDRCGGWMGADGDCTCWDTVLKVARTYLGEGDGS